MNAYQIFLILVTIFAVRFILPALLTVGIGYFFERLIAQLNLKYPLGN